MPSAPCHARMAALQNHRGQPLTDADGQMLKVGSTVVDSLFGEGIARGTVPLEKGDGVNVQIDWLGGNRAGKPPSRGIENLKLVYGEGMRTTSFVRGRDYESGAAHRRVRVEATTRLQCRCTWPTARMALRSQKALRRCLCSQRTPEVVPSSKQRSSLERSSKQHSRQESSSTRRGSGRPQSWTLLAER